MVRTISNNVGVVSVADTCGPTESISRKKPVRKRSPSRPEGVRRRLQRNATPRPTSWWNFETFCVPVLYPSIPSLFFSLFLALWVLMIALVELALCVLTGWMRLCSPHPVPFLACLRYTWSLIGWMLYYGLVFYAQSQYQHQSISTPRNWSSNQPVRYMYVIGSN